ncbi:nucleotidyltransferase family protein [Tenuibacillus multivorans]|uniref:Polymerase nucleotidyl transferase domain-containing protein n=1 Tax=Tenuibacillus multivorans TaxID=237069 RepID=A0A1H0BSE1_9BACI|nr:nucleotidyltransferase family protein [Tenuibacillus multivorans]GEL77054.1 nucleotidyltransferase [Tenuibacillus multivorans]SDN48483.1 hypothetical protein SAMN05216498_2367 [Tenuibacillus multivorans]
MNIDNLNHRLQHVKPILKEEYHVSKIGYFGSYARNEQTDDSDIDILVEFSKPVGLEFIELKHYLEGALNKKVDLVTARALKPQIRDQILQEVIYQ